MSRRASRYSAITTPCLGVLGDMSPSAAMSDTPYSAIAQFKGVGYLRHRFTRTKPRSYYRDVSASHDRPPVLFASKNRWRPIRIFYRMLSVAPFVSPFQVTGNVIQAITVNMIDDCMRRVCSRDKCGRNQSMHVLESICAFVAEANQKISISGRTAPEHSAVFNASHAPQIRDFKNVFERFNWSPLFMSVHPPIICENRANR